MFIELSSVTYLFTKMVNVGAFPPSRTIAPSQPSFFEHTLPTIRSRLHSSPTYAVLWTKLLAAIPSTMALQTIVSSLFAHLRTPDSTLDTAAGARAAVKREAELLRGLLGEVKRGQSVWSAACAVILNRDWGESHARIIACWAASAKSEQGNHSSTSDATISLCRAGLQLLLDAALDIWTSPEHIKHSLLSKHRCKHDRTFSTAIHSTLLRHHSPRPPCTRKPLAHLAQTSRTSLLPAFHPIHHLLHFAYGSRRTPLRHVSRRRSGPTCR